MSHLTPHLQFSVDFGAPVWQIRPDYQAQLLALEIRDGDRLQTDFAVLDVAAGKLLGAPYRAPENWWVGLEDIQNHKIYLHGFSNRQLGVHQGITAVEISSGRVLWQQEQGVYWGLTDDDSIIARSAPGPGESFIALNGQTGTIVEPDISPAEAHARVENYTRLRMAGNHYPVQHAAGSEYFNLLGQFISAKTGQPPIGAIDYLETDTFFALAYYLPVAEGILQNILGVYAVRDGTLLREVVLTAGGAGLSTGSFFMIQETLIFVQERNILVGYRFC